MLMDTEDKLLEFNLLLTFADGDKRPSERKRFVNIQVPAKIRAGTWVLSLLLDLRKPKGRKKNFFIPSHLCSL